jgi:hypothetical protein
MYYNPYKYNQGDRFVFPFLVGALTGGATVGLTRPRPIYNVAPGMPYGPMMPYGHTSYSYYYPTRPPFYY